MITCLLSICFQMMTSTVPGKVDWYMQHGEDTLIVQWLDEDTTLNIMTENGVIREWTYSG